MRRNRMIGMMTALATLLGGAAYAEEDPFAAGGDALAVADSDGSSSLRAKLKLKKMLPDMVMFKVVGVDDSKFPNCVVHARVLKAAKAKTKHFKLLARGKTYRFSPVFKKRGRRLDLRNKMNQNNLGACYFAKNARVVARIKGVDLKKKVFLASELYRK